MRGHLSGNHGGQVLLSIRCELYCPRSLHVLVRFGSNVSRLRSNRQESRSLYNAMVLRRRWQAPLGPSEAGTSAVTSRSVFRCRHEACNSASPRQRLHLRELHVHLFLSSYYRLGGSDVRDALSLRDSKRLSSCELLLTADGILSYPRSAVVQGIC